MEKIIKFKLVLIILLLWAGIVNAQPKQITGKVLSEEDNMPIPGVSVVIKGTTTGTATGNDGNFSLSVPSDANILVFSFIGFDEQTINISGKTTLKVLLKTSSISIDEVVAIGYGTMKKSDLTGAVSSVSSEVMKAQPSLRIEDAMQGKVAGVLIQRQSGEPDGTTRVRIRGINSLQGDNSPLYVIDGVLGANMNSVNVNDVASIEILKDASATAIYGSQGSNGVILVTTKSATAGKTVWSFNTKIGFDELIKEVDKTSPVEFMEVVNKAIPNAYSQNDMQAYINDPSKGTDWRKEVFRTGLNQDYQFSAQGGTEKMKFYASATYTDIQAIVKNDDYKRYGLRSNLDFRLNEKAKMTLNLNVSRIERDGNDIGILDPYKYCPLTEVYDDAGEYTLPNSIGTTTVDNPTYTINETKSYAVTNLISAMAKLDLTLFENLTYSFTGAAGTSSKNISKFKRYIPGALPSQSSATLTDSGSLNWQITNQLIFSKRFDVHTVNITAVQEMQKVTNQEHAIVATNFSSNALTYNNLGLASSSIASTNTNANTGYQLASFLGRANYGYMDKYLLTASIRADASSKFAKGNQWAYFPSAALAWKISNEEFFPEIQNLDQLKLRLSYGKVGSQAISPYGTLSNLVIPSTGIPVSDGTLSNAIELGDPANSDLKWETTAQYDGGLDLNMFDGRLSFVADYYYKKTSDLLYAKTIPLFAGTISGVQIQNIGAMENKGLELMASYDIIRKKDFKLNLAVNYSANRNKFLGINGIDEDILVTSEQYGSNAFIGVVPFVLQKGQPLGNIRGFVYEGPYRTEDQASADLNGYDLGAPKYKDQLTVDTNGDGKPDASDGKITTADAVVIGNGSPKYTMGFNLSMNYKNFDLSLFVQSVQGFDILNIDRYTITRDYTSLEMLNAWSAENNSSNQWSYTTRGLSNPGNTQYLEDGSFIRLKNITLGYTLPDKVCSKIGVSSLRMYLNAQNIFTITDYTWFDPEASTTGDKDQSQGVNQGSFPNPKSISVGINLNF